MQFIQRKTDYVPGELEILKLKLMDLKFHSSVLFCNDLQEQKEFYEKFLGQKVSQDLGSSVVFENGFTLWKLKKDFPISKELGYTYEPIGNRNLELCFVTDTFEDSIEKVLMADIRILHNAEEEEWGQYTIRFYDPEGNLIEVGESMKCMVNRMKNTGSSSKKISERSGLPEDVIIELLG